LTPQVECHPFWPQDKLRDFLNSKGIPLVAYSPLGNLDPSNPNEPSVLKDETIAKLAASYNKTPAQLVIRWGLQKGKETLKLKPVY